ncbi:MAG: sigma-70 family RNA polymerase sigma factor [Planctomycetaceae bacterium]
MALRGDVFSEVLESCRRFLLEIANKEVPADLRAKGGASDLVQQTFAAALRWESQFRGESIAELKAWLREILRTEAAVFRRQYYQTARRDVSKEVAMNPMEVRHGSTPQSVVIKAEETLHLSSAFSNLPIDYQKVVMLRMEQQMTFCEIGEKLGRSEDAARKLFSNAIRRLRLDLAATADENA